MLYLGIDIAKTNHVASLINDNGDIVVKAIKFTNSNEGYDKLIDSISSYIPSKNELAIAMEATGHYWLSLFSKLISDGFDVSLYNPFQIKSFRGAFHNRKQKNDVIDSIIIAHYVRTFGSTNSVLPDQYMLSLKQLTRYRSSLVNNISSIKNQIIGLLDMVFPEYASLFSDVFGVTSSMLLSLYPTPNELLAVDPNKLLDIVNTASRGRFGKEFVTNLVTLASTSFGIKLTSNACSFEIKQLINQISFIQASISELDSEIAVIYDSLECYLDSIPGIGKVNAPIILAEIGDINRFDNPRKLVAFVGIDPSENQSGNSSSTNAKTSKRGSPFLRHAIYTSAFVSMNSLPELRAYYDKKKLEGKHHYVAMAGVQRKFLGIIFSVLKENRPFIPFNNLN